MVSTPSGPNAASMPDAVVRLPLSIRAKSPSSASTDCSGATVWPGATLSTLSIAGATALTVVRLPSADTALMLCRA